MFPVLRAWATFGCASFVFLFSAALTRADEVADRWMRQRFAVPVSIQRDRDDVNKYVQRLSQAMAVPIEFDMNALQYSGITFSSSRSLNVDEQAAGEVLRLVLLNQVPNDLIAFVVVANPASPPAPPLKIVITTRREIQKLAPFVAPADPYDAHREMYYRLARVLNLDAENGTLDRHLQRLSDRLGLPIDWHVESINAAGVTYNQSFSISAGEKSTGELLDLVLDRAAPDKKLSYFVAEDDRRRTPQRIRVVVASRQVIESNPARFTPAARRPAASGYDVDAVLQKRVSLRLERSNLGEAVRALEKESGVRIRCTSFRYEELVTVDAANQPLGEVLKKMLEEAQTPKRPLVFTVFRRPASGIELEVFPREWVDSHGWLLPEVFRTEAVAK